jgi:F-type H+-transporting ATPase subunit b
MHEVVTAPLISFNWTIVMNWITIVILFLVLKHFFFEKVHKFVAARQQAVQDTIDNADLLNQRATEKLAEYNQQLADAESKGRDVIKESKLRADARAKEIIDEANQKASGILVAAEKEIEREKAKATLAMREQIASLAIYAAEKILEKELDKKDHEAIIDSVIAEAGSEKWNH